MKEVISRYFLFLYLYVLSVIWRNSRPSREVSINKPLHSFSLVLLIIIN